MKLINRFVLGAVAAVALGTTSCSDDTPDYKHFPSKDVDFTYNVDGDEYTLDYYVVSHVQFNNTSSKQGAVTWDFGDGTTSNEPNPVHKFAKAGTYRVTLTVDGVGSQTYPILIYDIVPVLSVEEQSTEIIEFNNTTMTFNLELPNPEDLRVRYEWKFPEGTTFEDGTPVSTFTGYSQNGEVDYPAPVKFKNIGSQRIEISTWFDLDGENRRLEDTYLNVQVGVDEPAPTLYYAQVKGNIKALKLIDPAKLPEGTKVLPFDMGVSAGSTVMNMLYGDLDATDADGNPTKEGWIYILDAGKQYYYINDTDGILGDGLISAMRPDGTGLNTVITNVGGPAFLDPFHGTIYNGYIYYTDRNMGVSRVDCKARGEVQASTKSGDTYLRAEYVFKNELVPYYGRGIAYGASHVALQRDSRGVWWMDKYFNGNCIIRYKDSDIYQTQKEAEKAALPYPVIMSGLKSRSMVIDEKRKAMYIWRLDGANEGFCAFDLPGDTEGGSMTPTTFLHMEADPMNTTAEEQVSICQLVVHNETGRVYFCWRPTATDASGIPAGIVYYDPDTKKIVKYGETNDLATGLCINPNPTKLF